MRGQYPPSTPIFIHNAMVYLISMSIVYLSAIQEAITEGLFGELRGYEFYNSSRFHLGGFGQYILVDLGLWNGDLDGVRKSKFIGVMKISTKLKFPYAPIYS
jgi:hypothetical protein